MGRTEHDALFYSGRFGLERETLRVDSRGRMAQTLHPFGEDPQITRDFCENQTEIITGVCPDVHTAVQELEALDRLASGRLAEQGESLWLYSNPPHFERESDIPIAQFTGDHSNKRSYREALEMRYGKRLMLFSGVHFNFSFPPELLQRWYDGSGSLRDFTDALYLRLYRQLMRHTWLLVLLTAASPLYDASLDGDGRSGTIRSIYGSLRNSARGYWNQFIPILDHRDLAAFTGSIREYLHKGLLFSASELYLPVRLKPRGVNSIDALAHSGVDHIELRMFDLNPLTASGVSGDDLCFAHLLILYLLSLPDAPFTPEQQETAIREHRQAALYHPPTALLTRAGQILRDMQAFYRDEEQPQHLLDLQLRRLHGQRLCECVPDPYPSSDTQPREGSSCANCSASLQKNPSEPLTI